MKIFRFHCVRVHVRVREHVRVRLGACAGSAGLLASNHVPALADTDTASELCLPC